jgi:DeoR/GlpR family transcriptional regulator of sugar metabolism
VERSAKEAMAAKAVEMIADDSVVLLDIGTSTALIARRLRGRPATVITSNLAVLDELRGDNSVRLVLLGGVLRRNYQSLVGSLTELTLGRLSADIVFLGCTGFARADGSSTTWRRRRPSNKRCSKQRTTPCSWRPGASSRERGRCGSATSLILMPWSPRSMRTPGQSRPMDRPAERY